jgi:hypothetical protein
MTGHLNKLLNLQSNEKKLRIEYADLSQFSPYGNAVYGIQENTFHPIKGDPPMEPNGGFVYFENCVQKSDFEGFLRMMDVRSKEKDYSAFMQESSEPSKDRYLTQLRIVPKFALRYFAKVINDEQFNSFEEQDLTIGEALWEFMDFEKNKYGTSFFNSPKLSGKMGGDGNFAREELSFGFMVENGYFNICRIWSRAWLVTK